MHEENPSYPPSCYLPPPLVAQDVLVDGQGTAPTPPVGTVIVSSISAAASLAMDGDTIFVWGMVDNGTGGIGLEVAYSDSAFFSGQLAETFPITLRDGVTIMPAPGSPRVIIAPEVGTSATLMAISNAAGDLSASTTRIEGLNFGGGSTGLRLDADSGEDRTVLVLDCFFDSNGIGVSAVSTEEDTVLNATIRNCRITDFASSSLLANPSPIFTSQFVGIRLQAGDPSEGASTNASVNANINSLSVSGPPGAFDSMGSSKAPPASGGLAGSYYEINGGGDSNNRLVDSSFAGNSEHSGLASPGEAPFPFVNASLNGCMLDGHAFGAGDTGRGWDYGVHCSSQGPFGKSVFDYYAGWEVTISGSTMDDFREGGVHGFTRYFTRGLLNINGGTVITDTGFTGTGSGNRSYRHSGVYLESYESYVGIEGFKFESRRNLGHGLFAYTQGSVLGAMPYDAGVFVGLNRCQFYSNSHYGIEMRNFDPEPGDTIVGIGQGAIVGGTWNSYDAGHMPNGLSIATEGDEPMFGIIPIGQGYINACQVYENSGIGIHAAVSGNTQPLHSVCNRIINSYIWNNPGGGFVGDLNPHPTLEVLDMPSMYVPLIHCTLVGNGDPSSGSDYSVEIDDLDTFGVSGGSYEFEEVLDPSLPGSQYFGTKFLSTIFDRNGLGVTDFGPIVFPLLESGQLPGGVPDDRIGTGGIRGEQNGIPFNTLFSASTSDIAPYVGGAIAPNRWFLNPLGSTFSSFTNTLSFLSIFDEETPQDFELDPRPGTLFLRDKGADHVQ